MSENSIALAPAARRIKPKGLTLRNNVWWVEKCIKGKRYRFSTQKTDLDGAKTVLEMFTMGSVTEHGGIRFPYIKAPDKSQTDPREDAWSGYVSEQVDAQRSWFWQTLSSFDKRTRKKGYFDNPMSEAELVRLLLESSGRCAVSGLLFEFGPGSEKSPCRCSVDRIDSTIGYTLENCRAVCLCVNYALNAWGEGALLKMAQGVVLKALDSMSKAGNATTSPVTARDIADKATARRQTRKGRKAPRYSKGNTSEAK